MKFEKVIISNFRQYYDTVPIDLSTAEGRNIVLIGGRNGYGKTNFLISIVWCLYGEKISNIDENFKREIQKEKNYSQFMKQSLNLTALKENISTFSVELVVSGIDTPDSINQSKVCIKRQFNIETMSETLKINGVSNNNELFEEDLDKINFINDYVIPLEAAKFVFFDAEKIAELANLSAKEEGSFLNDALGKILGLDVYEDLIEDLEFYVNSLKKEGAKKNLQEQIVDKEKAIELTKIEIESLDEENVEILKKIEELKKDVRLLNDNISLHSKSKGLNNGRETIVGRIAELDKKKIEIEARFHELSETIPLSILTGNLIDIKNHFDQQELNSIASSSSKDLHQKVDQFIERLFNHPPEPKDSTLTLSDKVFYYDKAKSLGDEIFTKGENFIELDFEHDFSKSDVAMLDGAINLINSSSKDLFQLTIDEYNSILTQLKELNIQLNKIDADQEDELISEYVTKKEKFERIIEEHFTSIGSNKEGIKKLQKDIERLNQQYTRLITTVEINQKNRKKITKAEKYIDTLVEFVQSQKELKKESLGKSILDELKKLMHKLNLDSNHFISNVNVNLLAEGRGMKISLYDSSEEEIKKEILSQGEKQLYISSLIKAILKESIQSLPIFIDTPLGRLDDEHIKNILLYYYPDLSEQIIILSTNNEITPKRYKDISSYISSSYLLDYNGNNTKIILGYFK